MANTQAQFGFQPFGVDAGRTPNFGLRRRTIAYNYSTSLFRGDPVASNSAGNIVVATSQTAALAGIFWGVEYYNSAMKQPFWSPTWPGSAASVPTNGLVTAWIIDDPDQLFVVASLGSTAAISKANIMNNIQWAAGAGGNTTTGISSYVIDDGNIATTNTLPFKIMDLYSTTACPGQNGADDTTIYNWAIVKMNNTDRVAGTTGV